MSISDKEKEALAKFAGWEVRDIPTAPWMGDGKTIYQGLPNPFEATRYHSLIIRRETLPACLEISAETDQGEIMGVRHKEHTLEGVQFHPESILTTSGKDLLRNFLAL